MILFFLKFSFIEQKEKKIILHDMLSIKGAVARSPNHTQPLESHVLV